MVLATSTGDGEAKTMIYSNEPHIGKIQNYYTPIYKK